MMLSDSEIRDAEREAKSASHEDGAAVAHR
jgi:hypothetical protein